MKKSSRPKHEPPVPEPLPLCERDECARRATHAVWRSEIFLGDFCNAHYSGMFPAAPLTTFSYPIKPCDRIGCLHWAVVYTSILPKMERHPAYCALHAEGLDPEVFRVWAPRRDGKRDE